MASAAVTRCSAPASTTRSNPVPAQTVAGLGLLPAETVFDPDKVVRWTAGQGLGVPVSGYEIRHGRTRSSAPWITTDRPGDSDEGCSAADGRIAGTSLHGLLESDAFRSAFLATVARRVGAGWAPSGVSFAAAREARFDRLATAIETHLDLAALKRLIGQGKPVATHRAAAP